MSDICFENLCGKHTFSGCELTSEDIECFYGVENCGICLFMLDGVTYKAVEDPDDGYRSYCRDLRISEKNPRYCFPAIEVVCSMMKDRNYERNDVLVVRDAENGKVILQVGTRNTDDYYPYCWFKYTPENMACNQ